MPKVHGGQAELEDTTVVDIGVKLDEDELFEYEGLGLAVEELMEL